MTHCGRSRVLLAVTLAVCAFALTSAARAQDFTLDTNYQAFSPEARGFIEAADKLIIEGKYDAALGKLREASKNEKGRERDYDIKIRDAMVNLYRGRVGYSRFLLNVINRNYFYAPALIAAARTYIYYPPYDRIEGKKRLHSVLVKEPKNWMALTELGYCDFFLGNAKEAKVSFEKALEINRRNMQAFYGLADLMFSAKEYMNAIHLLEDAIRVAPENPETMKKIGDIYMGSTIVRRTDSAVSWYDQALEFGQSQPKYYAAVMLAFFARYTAGNAKPYYERLKKVAPDGSYVTWADGVFLELQGRIAAALQKYEEAVAQDSRNWYAHFSRANIYAARGNEEYVRWAKTANYKYHAHSDTQKGLEAYKMIKNNAPTFPFIGVVNDWYHFLMERPSTSPWSEPAFKEKLQRMKAHGAALKKGMY